MGEGRVQIVLSIRFRHDDGGLVRLETDLMLEQGPTLVFGPETVHSGDDPGAEWIAEQVARIKEFIGSVFEIVVRELSHHDRPHDGPDGRHEPLQTLLPRLRQRPGLYVPRVSYLTVSAFLDGYALGSSEPLDGFRLWLIARGTSRPELWWTSLVLARLYPPDALPDPRTFTEEEDMRAIAMLFELLEEFYESTA